MNLTFEQLNQLSDLALSAVSLAGKYIKQYDRKQLHTQHKNCGSSISSQVVTEVDMQCQALLIKTLQASCTQYDIALLSEENCSYMPINEHPRLTQQAFWCIDPLDGTLPFIEGRDGYAVSVALVSQAGNPILSAIYLPASDTSYQIKFNQHQTAQVLKNGQPFKPKSNEHRQSLHLYFDQSFLNTVEYKRLLQQLTGLLPKLDLSDLQVISGHGAVVNALMSLENCPACYIKLPKAHQGGGAIWDFSGTACISHTLEAWVSDINGQPLTLNQRDSYYMNEKGVLFASDNIIGEAVVNLLKN
ncbi:inositol-1-monophosphatase [Psychromonas sp. psych-6C06]|uniref:3'(2'),5'-bisphosphate nucleotidase CysQ family protein n=1 Tax=Psychromonas sp. psych-6C06 TaxID=2058089 RepID=UPI000C32C177|nr:inositol monophosphatase family protein [Psychromonas sp. psych-6C06]PKF60697.1 inositol-1-monophosphatase [Psychromonas sp. psych-6C06]